MTRSIIYIYLIGLIFTTSSCGSIKKDHRYFEASIDYISIDSTAKKNNISDPLLLGNHLTITYASYGCFHYLTTTLEIIEKNGNYLVTLRNKDTDRQSRTILFDSTFRYALAQFSQFYYRVLNDQANLSSQVDNISIGTVRKLTIEGGLRKIDLFCNKTPESQGFQTLVNFINLPIVK